MNFKVIKTTMGITLSLFTFICFLLYLIYCFAYYDDYKLDEYFNKYNDGQYTFIYNNMADKDGLEEKEFTRIVNLMNDKKELKEKYYLYYGLSETKIDEFFDEYYFGDSKVGNDDITYTSNGKTGIFSRKAIFYDDINISNKKGNKVSLGVKRNIKFLVEDEAILFIDGKSISCDGGECLVRKMFGGLHEVQYTSNNIKYFAIVNVKDDEEEISITNLESLIKITESSLGFENPDDVEDAKIKIGTYRIDKCYIEDKNFCASKRHSYLKLNKDGTVDEYLYLDFEIAAYKRRGTYRVDGNFLITQFDETTYNAYDYDTSSKSDIVTPIDMTMRFRIVNEKTLMDNSYMFVYKG